MQEILKTSCIVTVEQRERLSNISVELTAYPGDSVYIQSAHQLCNILFKVLCGLQKPKQGQVFIQNSCFIFTDRT